MISARVTASTYLVAGDGSPLYRHKDGAHHYLLKEGTRLPVIGRRKSYNAVPPLVKVVLPCGRKGFVYTSVVRIDSPLEALSRA